MSIHAFILTLFLLRPLHGKVYDAGRIEEGTPILHTFVLVNNSKDTIYITKVRHSCGCTTTELRRYKILPLDTLPINVRINTYGFRGHIQKSVFIFYKQNQRNNLLLTLKIKAYITKDSEKPLSVWYTTQDGLVFDLRSGKEYEKCHVVGSEHITEKGLEKLLKNRNFSLPDYVRLYILMNDTTKAKRIIRKIRKLGYQNAFFIRGGIKGWKESIKDAGLICKP